MDTVVRVVIMLAIATGTHLLLVKVRKKLRVQKTWSRRNEIFYLVIVTILLLGVVSVVGLDYGAVVVIGVAYGIPGLFGRPLFTITK